MAWSLRKWTRDDQKLFEGALVLFPENQPYRFYSIAEYLNISVNEVMYYNQVLDHDVMLIESGQVSVPHYPDNSPPVPNLNQYCRDGRKKGIPWTRDEHMKFLKGLEKYGKGSWKKISRHCVLTKSPSQVASHAQKYYKRQEDKAKKRSSIHDKTLDESDQSNVEASPSMEQPNFPEQTSSIHDVTLESQSNVEASTFIEQPNFPEEMPPSEASTSTAKRKFLDDVDEDNGDEVINKFKRMFHNEEEIDELLKLIYS